MARTFVHLHLHSQYSLLEASCQIAEVLEKAMSFGMPSLALTDSGNMFGAMEFYFMAQKKGIKPILGFDAYLAPVDRLTKNKKGDPGFKPNTRLVLLAQNHRGYQNLCKLSTMGYQEGFYYKPRIDLECLKDYGEDLIALTGGFSGDLFYHLKTYGEKAGRERLLKLREIFGDRLYIEINRTGQPQYAEFEPFLFELGQRESVPLVAANDVYYLNREDKLARDVLVCIGTNRTLRDRENHKLVQNETDEHFFKSSEQMYELFKDCPELCERSLEISDRCHLEFQFKDESGKTVYHLPGFPTKNNVSVLEELGRLSQKGLKERLESARKKGQEISEQEEKKYSSRLDYEIGVIDSMGFTSYFLIVQDFINWAKKHGIPVGPGRGSGAGSLVAYCLKITDIDPVRYNLIFERFLNPERISMPDFDIDFCQEKRPQVLQYVTEKYGKASVSQIITYGKLQARAAIRDVGRVLGMSYSEVDVIAKLIPDKLGISLQSAIDTEPRIVEQMESNPQVNSMIHIALKVEGLVRHAGIHAAGVIIADGELVKHAPLYKGVDGENVIQYDMKHAEKIGLIKFDFLGLKTLTYIQYALDLIEKNHACRIQSQDIDIDDSKIYQLMSKGDSAGVFQFEGDGITSALKRIKPTCFEDIMAINALYRPGPMDMIPEYTKRKHGKSEVEYIFHELEDILKETYGVIVYQEQVQLIASVIASYSLGEADLLRRAMGKKIISEMNEQRERFLEGALKNGYDKKLSEKLFDLMAEFAKYGFNKSHSAAYCVIAAQTAWLKASYPAEFYAAILSTEMNDTDKVVKYIKICRHQKINIHPPHINHSGDKFTVEGQTLYYSLSACKGLGQSAVEAILSARERTENKKFESLNHFFETVDLRRLNKKGIEALIKAGALDDFGFHRKQLYEGFESLVESAEKRRKEQEIGQKSLFSLIEEEEEQQGVSLPNCEPWSRMTKLRYEKEILGFYLSDHPLNGFEDVCRFWFKTRLSDLGNYKNKEEVTLVGMVSSYREIVTKKGTRMAFLEFEDSKGASIEVIIFPDRYSQYEDLIKKEEPLILSGTFEKRNENQKILVEKLTSLYEGIKNVKYITFKLNLKMKDKLKHLRDKIDNNPGQTQVRIHLDLDSLNKKLVYSVQEPKGISLTNELLEDLQRDFGSVDFIDISV